MRPKLKSWDMREGKCGWLITLSVLLKSMMMNAPRWNSIHAHVHSKASLSMSDMSRVFLIVVQKLCFFIFGWHLLPSLFFQTFGNVRHTRRILTFRYHYVAYVAYVRSALTWRHWKNNPHLFVPMNQKKSSRKRNNSFRYGTEYRHVQHGTRRGTVYACGDSLESCMMKNMDSTAVLEEREHKGSRLPNRGWRSS